MIIAANGTAGGLSLMWKDECNLSISWSTERIICRDVTDDKGNLGWSFLACHGPPYNYEKNHFWSHLAEIVNVWNCLWILFGDLNEVIDSSEKFGGRPIWRRRLHLKNFMQEVDGCDLEFIGGQFT